MQANRLAPRVYSRPFTSGLLAVSLLALCLGLASGCAKPLRGTSQNTGGTSPTGGAVGAGGTTGQGGAAGTGGTRDAAIAPDAATCDALATGARSQFQAYLDNTSSLACQVDSDCIFLHEQSLNCFAACGQLVSQSSSSAATAAAAHVCDGYVAAGCPEILLLCPASKLICDGGQCAFSRPGLADPATDGPTEAPVAHDAATGTTIDADETPGCSSPSTGAACTPEQTPCATCCTDHWTCTDGVWRNQFLGCLPTSFSCGDQACNESQSYCRVIPALSGGELPHPALYSCETLPSPCNGRRCPTCDCLAQAGIVFSACTSNAAGAIYVTQ